MQAESGGAREDGVTEWRPAPLRWLAAAAVPRAHALRVVDPELRRVVEAARYFDAGVPETRVTPALVAAVEENGRMCVVTAVPLHRVLDVALELAATVPPGTARPASAFELAERGTGTLTGRAWRRSARARLAAWTLALLTCDERGRRAARTAGSAEEFAGRTWLGARGVRAAAHLAAWYGCGDCVAPPWAGGPTTPPHATALRPAPAMTTWP